MSFNSTLQNILYLANLTKFCVVPTHLVLHFFKVCLDDFSGTNVENLALLLENCGRFLLRSDDTKERFAKMVGCAFFRFSLRVKGWMKFFIARIDASQAEHAAF
jgi:hypothetical protein